MLSEYSWENIAQEKLLSQRITLKSFIKQNRPIDIALKHCFDVTLADFEQKINDFMQLEAKSLNEINHFSGESNKFRITFVQFL